MKGGISLGTRNRKVVKYRRPIRLNIGVIIFLFILVYILIISMSFFNKKRISIYEVNEKNIADDNTCQGIIIREENVITANRAGYVNYYIGDGSRVAKNATVCTLDESGSVYESLSNADANEAVPSVDSEKIRNDIAQFKKNYIPSNFSQVQDFQYDINNTVLESSHINTLSNLKSILEEQNVTGSFHLVKSPSSGVVTYFADGLESLAAENVTPEHFNQEQYQRTQLRNKAEAVEAGAGIYKMVTSDKWSVVLSLTLEQYEKLHEKETEQLADQNTSGRVMVNFVKNDLNATVNFTAYQKGDAYFARLDLDKYLNYFIDDRYVEVELKLNAAEGLKIPTSAVLERKFYLIPLSCLTLGGNSNNKGIAVEVYNAESEEVEYQFVPTDIYYEDEEFAYIDSSIVEAGTWIRDPNTQERFQISGTESMTGVYNANKGYCVFRRIEKIYENEEYCIVKKDSPYGLSTYDHIIVDASMVTEQEIMR